MMHAKAFISGEKLTVYIDYFFYVPPSSAPASAIRVLLSSYGREDLGMTGQICSRFWIDMGETENCFPLT